MIKTYKIIVIAVFLLGNLLSMGQQNIAATGSYFENNEFSVSWGVGELAIETFSSGNYIVTQGFQQSKLEVTNIDNTNSEFDYIEVYPNPTSDFVYLNFKDKAPLACEYQMIDTEGKVMNKQKITEQSVQVSFVNKKTGVYFMRIFSDKTLIKTFKIVKK